MTSKHQRLRALCLLLAFVGCAEPPVDTPKVVELRPIEGWDSPLWTGAIGAEDPVVARVDGATITKSMLEAQLARQPEGTELSVVLERMIEFELLARAARDAGHYTEEVVGKALRRGLVRAFIKDKFERQIGPSDLPEEFRRRAYKFMAYNFDHFEIFHVRDAQILCCQDTNPDSCYRDEFERVEDRREHLRQCFEYHAPVAEELRAQLSKATSEKELQEIFDVASLDLPSLQLRDQFYTKAGLAEYEFQYDVDRNWEEQFGKDVGKIHYKIFAEGVTETAKKAWLDGGRKTPVLSKVGKSEFGYHIIFITKVEPEQHWGIDHPEVVKQIEANAFAPWREIYFHEQLQQLCERVGCEANENRLVPLQEAEASGS